MADSQGYYLYNADGELIAGDIALGQNMLNMAKELGGWIIDQSTGDRIELEG